MKRVLIIFIMLIFSGFSLCQAEIPDISTGIEQYQSGDYETCINTMKTIVKEDPTEVLGYYYLGLAYSKTGRKLLAIQNYNRVITLNTDKTLVELAKKGKDAFGEKNVTAIETQLDDIEDELRDNPILNDRDKLSPEELKAKYEDKTTTPASKVIKASDYVNNTNQQQTSNSQPTNDDIVNAIRTLQKAGILNNGITPMQAGVMPMPIDSRTQQMNSMLMMMNNNNNNNGMMNMMPYMNNGGNVDPQLMQMMLMNQMMPNFSTGGNNGNGY